MARGPSSRGPAPRGPSPRDENSRRRGAEPAPWLDNADYDDEDEDDGRIHTLIGRRTLWVILFLLAALTIGVIVGIGLVSNRDTTPIDVPDVGERIPVIPSPGPWKVEPSGPDVDGTPVEGQGQILFGTGVGQETEAQIALDQMPEDPMERPGARELVDEGVVELLPPEASVAPAAPKTAAPKPVAAKPVAAPVKPPVVPKPKADLPVAKMIQAPEPEPKAPSASGGAAVQLGAFSSEGRARAAFKSLADRFNYLNGLEPIVMPVVSDGRTLYRLRVPAGGASSARDICAKLKVAGESCSVVN